MKKFSKILSVALLVALVLSLGVANAFADDTPAPTPVPTAQVFDDPNEANSNGKYTISVASTDTHTYRVFQVLKGTLVAGTNKLGDVAWGADVIDNPGDVNDFITAINAANATGNAAVSDAVAAKVKTTTNGRGTVDKDNSMDVDPGYYLLVDATTNLADGDSLSLNIVSVFNDIQITPKRSTTTSDKEVDDKVDSSNAEDAVAWSEDADYDVGDKVPFRLTATIAQDYANYTHGYKLTFHDKMDVGLTFNEDVEVYVGDTKIENPTEGTPYYTVTKNVTHGTGNDAVTDTFDVHFENLKDISSVEAGSKIYVTFTATLNDQALIGSTGNKNESHITYSNNPNDEQGGENGKTPDDVVIVFTYKLVVNKVEKDGANTKPLTGADFKLFKKYTAANATEAGKTAATMPDKGVTAVDWALDEGYIWVEVESKTVSDNGTVEKSTFTFSRIDDGDYMLVETKTPAGYNSIAPQKFSVTATHDGEALVSLNGKETTGEVDLGTLKANVSVSDGSLTTDVLNQSGTQLPSTGGIGTTIFYVVGGVLVLAAIILLVTKKRMSE